MTRRGLRQAFVDFVAALPGAAVLCLDDPGAAALVAVARHPVTYGTDPRSDYRIDGGRRPSGTGVSVRRCTTPAGASRSPCRPLPGVHNARNATAALAWPTSSGWRSEAAAAALRALPRRGPPLRAARRGRRRRARRQLRPPAHGGGRRTGRRPRRAAGVRVVCCFQPHRYSRTEALVARPSPTPSTTPTCWSSPTSTPPGEAPRPGVTGKLIVDAVLDAHPWRHVVWLPTLDDVTTYLAAALRPGDLCLTLGAGDLTTVPDRVLRLLEASAAVSERAVLEAVAAAARPARAARRAARPADHLPRRWRRRAARPSSRTMPTWRPWPPWSRTPGSTCSSSARAPTCSSPTPASQDWPSCSARGSRPSPSRAAPCTRARRPPCRSSLAGRWLLGSRASSGPSACRAPSGERCA